MRRSVSLADRLPPQLYFFISAVFHYLGPSFAVILFSQVAVLGVAWLRIASAALIFGIWRRPWRLLRRSTPQHRRILVALGLVLGLMNASFYLAIARLPLATVGAIEFLGQVILAAIGAHTRRNFFALGLAIAGVVALTDIQLGGQPLGFLFAFGNCALFMLYVVLGHRIAQDGGSLGIDRLGVSMLVAFAVISPIGLNDALVTFTHPQLLLAGVGIGICSSVIPYVTDQFAMARLPRPTFALMLALLPAFAAIIGAVVLRQIPGPLEITGIALIMLGVAVHQEPESAPLPFSSVIANTMTVSRLKVGSSGSSE
jgi:inner membrane transporter RhtA